MTKKTSFDELISITEKLRGENGCPWDREQTRESIKPYLIEEAYEVIEAIDHKDPEKIKEELGDLLFQVMFHARMSEERDEFSIHDVIAGICSKLVHRHPHVFDEKKINGSEEVIKQWEDIKRAERRETGINKALHGVPEKLPGLIRAQRLQQKAASVGFDWKNSKGIIDKIHEETNEVLEALKKGDRNHIEDEIGDLLFAIVNLSRFTEIHAEEAIRKTIKRFIFRFEFMESKILESNRELKDVSLEEMDTYWNEAKSMEAQKNYKPL